MGHRYCQSCGREVAPGRGCKCRSQSFASTPPYRSRAYCRACVQHTRWIRTAMDNGGARPPVLYWACEICGSTRYQYADCTNVETMCQTVLDENLRRTGANLDHDEAFSRLELEAWRLYKDWRRDGLPFESYGFGILRRRANDIYRQQLGRNGEKPLANALSLDTGGGPGGEGGIWTETYVELLCEPGVDPSMIEVVVYR